MDKKTYLSQFSKLMRWRFPTEEAEDIISDYAELLNAQPEDSQALMKNLGSPFAAATQLKPSKEYYRWLAVFLLLALCSVYFFFGIFNRWRDFHTFNLVLFCLSITLAVFWKQTLSPKKENYSCHGLSSALIGLLALVITVNIIIWKTLWSVAVPVERAIVIYRACIYIVSGISVISMFVGLIKCRIQNRRWLALTILSLTALFVCLLWMMILTTLSDPDELLPFILRNMIPPSIIGAVGVIWSLC